MKPVSFFFIKDKIKKDVSLLKENIFNLSKEDILSFNDEVVLLENIRFYPEEEANDDKFSEKLASLGEIYVNDAFSCSHRNHASVSNITKLFHHFQRYTIIFRN